MRKKLDIFGILVCSFLTALGGGTIRSLLLAKTPFYFYNNLYVAIILAGIVFAILTYRFFAKIEKTMLLIDAAGLTAFSLIGAVAAINAHMGLFGIISLSVLNAVGGGILRDAVIKELPTIFLEGLYATPAAIIGLLYGLGPNLRHNAPFVAGILILGFCIRLTSIYWNTSLWTPAVQELAEPSEA